jgi:hypothetical protein
MFYLTKSMGKQGNGNGKMGGKIANIQGFLMSNLLQLEH